MEDYYDMLHQLIKSLFKKGELKFDILLVEDIDGKINHPSSVGVKVVHIPSGKEAICKDYEYQIQNANIALLKLKNELENG